MKSPIRYFGSKGSFQNEILSRFPESSTYGFMSFNVFVDSDISKPYIKIAQRELKLERILK